METKPLIEFDVLTQIVVTLPLRVKATDSDGALLAAAAYVNRRLGGEDYNDGDPQWLIDLIQVDSVAEEPEGWEVYEAKAHV